MITATTQLQLALVLSA